LALQWSCFQKKLTDLFFIHSKKIGIAVVLRSEAEGAGKGIVVEWFGKEVIGQAYYTKIDEIGQLTSCFTKCLAGKLFTLCDEIQN